MGELKDIGGGFKMADVTAQPNPIEQEQKVLSLVDLANKIKQAPVDQATKEAELKLKQNDVENIALNNHLAQAKLNAQYLDNQLKQGEVIQKKFSVLAETANMSDDAFLYSVGTMMPGSKAEKDPNTGTWKILKLNADKSITPITIVPQNLTDPEKIDAAATKKREEWQKVTDEYGQIYNHTQTIKDLALKRTGIGDVGMLEATARIFDPNARITEYKGHMVAENIQNLPTALQIKIKNAMGSDTNLPLFNDDGRQKIVAVAESELATREKQARFYANGMKDTIGNIPRNRVFSPVGDLNVDTLFAGQNGQKTAQKETKPSGNAAEVYQTAINLQKLEQQNNKSPDSVNASFFPTQKESEGQAPIKTKYDLRSMSQSAFQLHRERVNQRGK
jgi:hypothetical protein